MGKSSITKYVRCCRSSDSLQSVATKKWPSCLRGPRWVTCIGGMAKRSGAVHVATTTRRYKHKVYQTHLLRRTYREDGKVKHETLGNISHLPPDLIEVIRRRLRGKTVPEATTDFQIVRSWPHGHVAAVLGVLRQLGVDELLGSRRTRQRDLVVALIGLRLLAPASKLASARALREETASSSLFLELGLEAVDDDELYAAMDWLVARQERIESRLADRHLTDGSLVLYDVSSSYYTGTRCPLAQMGHNRDGHNGYPQIVYGLLCNSAGCPVAIEVFAGNTADPKTLQNQIDKLVVRFGLRRVIVVGDRGMLTAKRIEETLKPIPGLDWITALRTEAIRQLVDQGTIQLSLFDQQDLVEVQSADYPGERLIVCRNPLLALERARKREALLAATENELQAVVDATQRARKPLRGQDQIGLRVGRIINRRKVAKHFVLEITNTHFAYRRDEDKIAREAQLDGLYVIRTSVPAALYTAEAAVGTYKSLSHVEQAFRSLKTVDLKIRPIYHWLEERVRAHVFLCMLAYYVEWHLRRRLAPLLFDDEDPEWGHLHRSSAVAPAERSPGARQKDYTKRTVEGLPVHSLHTLLADLATLTRNQVRTGPSSDHDFYVLTQPTELQHRAFELLGVSP